MAVPVRTGAFQPLTIYDAPDVAITQFFDDEASAESFFDAMFRSERLSPIQRDSYQDALREQLGGNPVSDAIIGVITNPFVLLGFMFSPAGSRVTGRVFNQFAQKTWWSPMAETLNGVFSNTPMAAGGARHQARERDIIRREFYEAIQPSEEALAAHFKISTTDFRNPERIRDAALREKVEDVHYYLHASLDGVDQFREVGSMRAVERFNVVGYQKNKDGELVPQVLSSAGLQTPEGIELRLKLQDAFDSAKQASVTAPGEFGKAIPFVRLLDKNLRRKMFSTTAAKDVDSLLNQYDQVFLTTGLPEERIFVPRDYREVGIRYDSSNTMFDGLMRTDPTLAPLVQNYRNGINKAFKGRFARLFLRDGVTTEQLDDAASNLHRYFDEKGEAVAPAAREAALRGLIDPSKVRSHMRAHVQGGHSLNASQDGGTFMEDLYSLATSRGLMTSDTDALLKGINITIKDEKTFEKLLVDGFVQRANINNYMPRNSVEFRRPMLNEAGGVVRLEDAEFLPGEMVTGAADSFRVARQALAGTRSGSGVTLSRRRDHAVVDPDELERMDRALRNLTGEGLTSNYMARNDDEFRKVVEYAAKDGHLVPHVPLKPTRAVRAYENQSARDYVFYTLKPTEEIIEAQKAQIPPILKMLGATPGDFRRGRAMTPGTEKASLFSVMDGKGPAPEGGWRMADVYDQSVGLIGWNAEAQIARGVIPSRKHESVRSMANKYMESAYSFGIPSVMGQTRPTSNFLMRAGVNMMQKAAAAVDSSFIGTALPPNIREQFRAFHEANTEALSSVAGFKTSGYLYSTHLGLNLASVMLNLQQPYLHLAGQVGMTTVFRAQADALAEVNNYFQLRARRHGMARITPDERAALIRDSFEYPEETLLMGDLLESVDNAVTAGHATSRVSNFDFLTKELPMKLFEKGEWLNRLTTVHAMKRNYQGRGLATRNVDGGINEQFSVDTRRMVQETQFGADPFNTPIAFMTDATGKQASFLADPLMRMFYTFSLRTPLSLYQIGRRTGQIDPETGVALRNIRFLDKNVGGMHLTPFIDLIRLTGISAMMYEIGKPMGLDLARGGIAAAMTEVAGGERIFDGPPGTLPVRLPPVLSIPSDIIKGVFAGDAQLFSNALLRASVPGSIALSRALGTLPKIEGIPLAENLQKYYADYDNPNEEGLIPVYKFDGTLIDFRSPTQLILQGLGVNVGAHKHASNFDHYINTQRDVMSQMKGRIRNALIMENDIEKAQKLEAEYMKKFGIPVAFSKEQMRAGFDAINAPRTARVLERSPKEFRPFVQRMLAEDSDRLGLSPDQIIMGDTIAQRRKQGETYERPVPPEIMAQMQRLVEARGGVIEQGRRLAFDGFDGY